MYEDSSWLAWAVGMLAEGITPLLLLVFAVLFIVRGGRPRQGGLRFVGGAMALWAVTEVLGWPSQSRYVYDTVYYSFGPWFGANYAAISDLIGTLVAAVCWVLAGYGALAVVNDVAGDPPPAT